MQDNDLRKIVTKIKSDLNAFTYNDFLDIRNRIIMLERSKDSLQIRESEMDFLKKKVIKQTEIINLLLDYLKVEIVDSGMKIIKKGS